MVLKIYTDGGCRGNPGPGAIGIVIKKIINNQETTLCNFGKKIGHTTNNVAEYLAVIEAMRFLLDKNNEIFDRMQPEKIEFNLDSKLVASQLSGLYKVKDSNMRNLMVQVRILENQIGIGVSYHHIPREKNTEADFEVNKAFDKTN